MSECVHCRAKPDEIHGHQCAWAKKQGLAHRAPPRRALDVGDVVKVRLPVGKDRFELVAAIVISANERTVTLRIVNEDEPSFITNPLEKDWARPGENFPE